MGIWLFKNTYILVMLIFINGMSKKEPFLSWYGRWCPDPEIHGDLKLQILCCCILTVNCKIWHILQNFWHICFMSMFCGKRLVLSEIELVPLSCLCWAGWKLCSKSSEKAERGQPLMETLAHMTTASCYFWHADILHIKQMHGHTWLLGIVLFFCVHNLRFTK